MLKVMRDYWRALSKRITFALLLIIILAAVHLYERFE